VLISFGGVIGKISPTQITVLTLVELVAYCLNKVYVLQQYAEVPLVIDCGGTIFIHVFGAYFGLCAAKVLGPPADRSLDGSTYTSDLFSLVGTVFLWLFWPSFVAGALPSGEGQTTALINTVLALLSSTIVAFGLTPLLMKGAIGTVPIQNATLAGGVAIGATADLVGPFGAVTLGGLAGALSTWGFVKGPFFSDCDTCGIHNLHGMPGLLGASFSVIAPFLYPDLPIVASSQALGLVLTLAIACVSGAATGALLKAIGSPSTMFNDAEHWECELELKSKELVVVSKEAVSTHCV